jgi:CheY-like chemotaxis protein
MKVLILEDDRNRIDLFMAKFHAYDTYVTGNVYQAIDYLKDNTFDCIFLDHDLGEHNGCGMDLVTYLYNNPNNLNNDAIIIIHSWNIVAASSMKNVLPQAICAPFNGEVFLNLGLDK